MLENLENIKLIRELIYLKSEFDYKTSLLQNYNTQFSQWIEEILDLNSELREIYENKKNTNTINHEDLEVESKVLPSELEEVEISSDLKKFYREIVKISHPDKTKTNSFNQIYNEVNEAFKSGNKIEILLLFDRLGLDFEVSQEDKNLLKKEILDLKNKILLLEASYPYQWAIVEDENIKNDIALKYIRKTII